MAKYDVTYGCGHTATVQLYGPNKERESKIRWYETIDCPECYARRQAEAAAKVAPSMTGSAKQIAWAQKIALNASKTYGDDYALIANETSAAWWIDNRDNLYTVIRQRRTANETKAKAAGLTKSEIFKSAHAMTKRLVSGKSGISYQATFALVLREFYKKVRMAMAA